MQMNVLESFLCLYEEKNILRASAKLYISQQGLSRRIKSMEDELGAVLFERHQSGVEPTEICNIIYEHIEKMYAEYSLMLNKIKCYENESKFRTYTVAMAYGITNSVSSDYLFEYQKKHLTPRFEIQEWSQDTCVQKLMNNEIDVAFLVSPVEWHAIKAIPLIEGKMFVAMHKSHPLAFGTEPLKFEQINGERIITGVPENAIRNLMDHFCNLTGVHLETIVSSSNNLNFVNGMKDNLGIAPMTQTMAKRVTNPDIVVRPVLTPESAFLYYCTPIKSRHSDELEDFRRYVISYFKTTPVEDLLKQY